ncbi:MAG: FecR domain-containing protein [Kiritimatiellaeota bacterium]|nr:FecR domain-containing protein [Kiritimatiellota bacterium]
MRIRDYMMTGAVCVLVTAMQVFAQVEDAEEEDPGVTDLIDEVGKQGTETESKGFEPLVRAMTVRGEVAVMNPDVGTFAPVVKNKAYPLNSVFRTGTGASVNLVFSNSEHIELQQNTEVVVLAAKDNPKARSVRLVSGRIKAFLKDNLLEGLFSVETANVSCKNMAGRAEFSLAMEGENENFQVKTIRGNICVEGPQYTIPTLDAAKTVNVLTTPNQAMSRLTGMSGDFKIILDNGKADPADHVVFEMSPQAVVKIMRTTAAVGGRPIVSTLAMGPTGKARHYFTYAVGRAIIATGETIVPDAEGDAPVPLRSEETGPEKEEPKKDAAPKDREDDDA